MTITTIVAIPARLKSSRLPNKVLADINGKTMIERVLNRCSMAKQASLVALCTDSKELIELSTKLGVHSILTSEDCKSGSERIASVSTKLLELAQLNIYERSNKKISKDPKDFLIINVQGDQPFIDPNIIDCMANEFSRRKPTPKVLTPIYQLSPEKVHNPNIVKTLVAHDGRAIYFSRSALPYVRGVEPQKWHENTKFWGHVGIYGFRADVLLNWEHLPISPLEEKEKLEQLRLIEAGIEIGTFTVAGQSLSVDTAEQLEQARTIAKYNVND